jgi:hypothetical protein
VCCSKNSCCPRGPRPWQLWLSGSLWRLVYPRPCFNSHDRPIQAFRPSSDALVRVSRQIRARGGDDRSRRLRRGPLRAIIGGLFLAFPAIFPASATLIEKHVRERKEKAGLAGARRGKEAAALDAVGAALGSFGLAAFGLVIWLMIVQSPAWALVLAAASWLAVAVFAWQVRRWL